MSRRAFLVGAASLAAAPLAPNSVRADDTALIHALENSPYIYVSPLLASGRESTCHGEIWFGWLDGAAVGIVAVDRWKSRAIDRGLRRARIWVGDHGRWEGMVTKNEKFRSAPSTDARAEKVKDAALLDRLLATYDRKYPAEIGRWRDKMRAGFGDGSRALIRYVPDA